MPNPHAPATNADGLGCSGITKTGTAIRVLQGVLLQQIAKQASTAQHAQQQVC